MTTEFYSLLWCSRTVCAFPAWLFTETKRNLKLIWYPLFFNPQKNMIKLQCNAIAGTWWQICLLSVLVTVFSVWIIFILQLKDEIRMWSCCKSLFTGILPYTFMNYGLYISKCTHSKDSVNPVLIWLQVVWILEQIWFSYVTLCILQPLQIRFSDLRSHMNSSKLRIRLKNTGI